MRRSKLGTSRSAGCKEDASRQGVFSSRCPSVPCLPGPLRPAPSGRVTPEPGKAVFSLELYGSCPGGRASHPTRLATLGDNTEKLGTDVRSRLPAPRLSVIDRPTLARHYPCVLVRE